MSTKKTLMYSLLIVAVIVVAIAIIWLEAFLLETSLDFTPPANSASWFLETFIVGAFVGVLIVLLIAAVWYFSYDRVTPTIITLKGLVPKWGLYWFSASVLGWAVGLFMIIWIIPGLEFQIPEVGFPWLIVFTLLNSIIIFWLGTMLCAPSVVKYVPIGASSIRKGW